MTAMLASVTGPEEAEIAIAGGADIVDLKDPANGVLGALPVARVAETVARIAGVRPTSAVVGVFPNGDADAASAVDAVAATGVDYIKVGFLPDADVGMAARALAGSARGKRLVAVLFADLEKEPDRLITALAEAGFAGVMVDTADKSGGRLLAHIDIAQLATFVGAARNQGLLVGLAGGLEEPDVPRLLPLEPDFLGFRGVLCATHDRRARLDLDAVRAIRALIPRAAPHDLGKVDYRLLAARGDPLGHDDDNQAADRLYVRDFVLPVSIGAYSHERGAPQKVRFDVTVEVHRGKSEPSGMGEVFSYDLITDAISANVAAGHVDLVETLAERISSDLLRHPRARRVTVRIEKLELGPGGVGVQIVRERPASAAQQNPVLAMIEGGWRKPRG